MCFAIVRSFNVHLSLSREMPRRSLWLEEVKTFICKNFVHIHTRRGIFSNCQLLIFMLHWLDLSKKFKVSGIKATSEYVQYIQHHSQQHCSEREVSSGSYALYNTLCLIMDEPLQYYEAISRLLKTQFSMVHTTL